MNSIVVRVDRMILILVSEQAHENHTQIHHNAHMHKDHTHSNAHHTHLYGTHVVDENMR